MADHQRGVLFCTPDVFPTFLGLYASYRELFIIRALHGSEPGKSRLGSVDTLRAFKDSSVTSQTNSPTVR